MRSAWAVLAALALAPSAAAAISGDLLSYDDGTEMTGRIELLQLRAANASGPGAPWLAFTAARIEAVQYNATYLVSDQGPAGQPVNYQQDAPVAARYDLGAGTGRLEGSRDLYRLLAYAPSGVAMEAAAAQGSIISRGPVVLSERDLRVADGTQPATCDGERPDLPQFCAIERAGPLLLHTTDRASASVTLHAPLVVLELSGLDVGVDAERDLTLVSGRFPEEVAPVAGPVHRERDVFLRLILTDAIVEVAADGSSSILQWAGPEAVTQHAGPVSLTAARGPYQTEQGIVHLNHDRFVFAAGASLSIVPLAEDRLQVDQQAGPAPLGVAPGPVEGAAASLAIFALLVLPFAAVAGWLALRRSASLPAMEAAISAGRHRRAAYFAGRILRRDPAQEDARLGRAIALTKSGRAARAAKEIAAHLAGHNPSDGSLHYVLGLALLETGREAEGREALREAVRRTPALEADVRARDLKALPPVARAQGFKEGYSYV